MRQFFETFAFFEISPSSTVQFDSSIRPLATPQLKLSVKAIKQVTKSIDYPLGMPDSETINILESPEFIDKFLSISFTHHVLILGKINSWNELFFYISKTLENQWAVSVLQHQIASDLFAKQGKLLNNFSERLPDKVYPHALQAFKDEYLLDFLNIQTEDEQDERVFETEIVRNIKQFILSIGKEFTFMGNQYRLLVNGDEFFIDLLFYHRGLQCMIAFELKTGKFKPEYAGKLNFYLNALDEYVKLPHENTSIGIILCKEKNDTVVEFAFKTIDKPMGVATYKFTTELPEKYKKYLPNSEDLRKLL
jgi:predicted nuclease of restriction endonuclease-like (RecB) superfamily